MNTPFLISGKEHPTPPTNPNPERYEFFTLKDAEPNLGAPIGLSPALSAAFVLVSTPAGVRSFASTVNYDAVRNQFVANSAFWQNTYVGVRANSGNWNSTYTTLRLNSATWLTEPSASALFFKLTGGSIFGDVRVEGDLVVVGVLSALGGIATTDTKVVETTALRIVNIGQGPALYVEQTGFDDIAQFVDTEGGVALHIGNITPWVPGMNTGIIGINTEYPNHELTVAGSISATGNLYVTTQYFSGNKTLDYVIYEAIPPILQSTYATMTANSASWESVYSSWFSTSSQYATKADLSSSNFILSGATFRGDVRIFGNLFASGSSFLANTIITTTSALSVINEDKGPALYLRQGGTGQVLAEFYDAEFDNPVLLIGNAQNTDGTQPQGVIGIRTGIPNRTLTIAGTLSTTSTYNDLIIFGERSSVVIGRNVPTLGKIGGFSNVLIGEEVATNIGFSIDSVQIGYRAGRDIVDGSENVFIGSNAGTNFSNANSNVVVGFRALTLQGDGVGNVAVGHSAGDNYNFGSFNISIGTDAGGLVQAGSYNIHIGTSVNNTLGSLTTLDNTILVGREAQATRNQQFILGSPNYRYLESVFFGDIKIDGTLSASDTRVAAFTAVNSSLFRENATFIKDVNIIGNLTIGNITTAAGTLFFGDVTITKSLSVPSLTANNIFVDRLLATKPITAYDGIEGVRYVYHSQSFNSTGTTTTFTLVSAAYSPNEIMVFVSGVYQNKSAYSLPSPFTLLMSEAVPAGTDVLEVQYVNASPLPIRNTIVSVDDNTIGANKLTSNSVTTVKIADGNVTPIKLSTGAPSWDIASNVTIAGNISSNNIFPRANNTWDLGSPALRWRNIFTQDLHLSNSIGDYTIVEGEDNLYIINNKRKKTYKFALIEVDPAEVPKVSEKD